MRTRHGELDILKTSEVNLDGYELEANANGRAIVGHSETGAFHAVVSDRAKLYRKKGHDIAILVLPVDAPLVHDGHRHKTVTLPAGNYYVSAKRQYDAANGWSPVQD